MKKIISVFLQRLLSHFLTQLNAPSIIYFQVLVKSNRDIEKHANCYYEQFACFYSSYTSSISIPTTPYAKNHNRYFVIPDRQETTHLISERDYADKKFISRNLDEVIKQSFIFLP